MTIEQASRRFGVPLPKLQLYEKQGLFDCHKLPDGSIDYDDELMDYIGIINVLMDAGAEVDTLRRVPLQKRKSFVTCKGSGKSFWKISIPSRNRWINWITSFLM